MTYKQGAVSSIELLSTSTLYHTQFYTSFKTFSPIFGRFKTLIGTFYYIYYRRQQRQVFPGGRCFVSLLRLLYSVSP